MKSTSRYNSFNQIHKGLRALLYDTALKFQQTDLSDKTAGEKVLQQLELLLMLFESHAHNEDEFYNKPLEEVNHAVATMFEKEHDEDHRLGKVLADLIDRWRKEADASGRETTGRNLFYAFNEFIAFNLYHMNKEEIELNAVLWNEYSDDTIKATEQELVKRVPPQKMGLYAKWMIRGINDTELSTWLKEVKEFAPPEVFSMLIQLAAAELPSVRYEKLKQSLDASALAA
jgi:hypothetical protein